MAWVVSAKHLVYDIKPVPLALTEPGCQMRSHALAALDSVGKSYRIAYSSRSYTGLAVAVVTESLVTPEMRVLTKAKGFPAMPPVDVGLKHAPGSRTEATDELADALMESVRGAADMAA